MPGEVLVRSFKIALSPWYIKLGYERFLSYPFLFAVRRSSCYSTLYRL